jgi:hypothetical protein
VVAAIGRAVAAPKSTMTVSSGFASLIPVAKPWRPFVPWKAFASM